ncbi:nucleotidyltransferase domain-containing protein [Blautia schinkii]|nr:nucleotidyltransferase domain-containing protein [Blautia schinkii]
MTIAEILEEIKTICRKYKVKRVILFGSRAKETATERSDIDLAITGCSQFEELKEEIEEIPTLYSIDIVNLDTCRNQLLLEDIEKYGREIL